MNTTDPSDPVTTVIHESLTDEPEQTQDNLIAQEENERRNTSTHETEGKNSANDDTLVQPSSTTVEANGDREETKEATVNQTDDEQRPKRSFHPRVKYASMPYHRAPYYANGHAYGSVPYYYYPHPIAPINEKPTPLMFISTPATSVGENPPAVSPQNLPPRLRQPSATENEQNSQQSTAPTATQPASTTNGRRHRSILPRGTSHYYAPHPPPLMATPPGVVFSYPPTVHQPGHIAYNIRTADELELFALQQRFMNGQASGAPLLWAPPPPAYPPFAPYLPYDASPYLFHNSVMADSNSSLLNPEAEEWVPGPSDNETSASDNPILIDDEINFPPLNNNRSEEHHAEQKKQVEPAPNVDATNHHDIKTTAADTSAPKSESNVSNTSVNHDENKPIPPPSSSRPTPVTYSTVILQTSEVSKATKIDPATRPYQRRSQQPPVPSKDRPTKQQPQRTSMPPGKESSTPRRRPPPTPHRNHTVGPRNVPVVESTKPTSPMVDDWIEVKSKKTKKFDRTSNDIHYDESSSKTPSHEPVQKTLSPPLSTSSLSSTAENTTATCTSEEDDEKDDLPNAHDSGLMMIVETPITAAEKDYNQEIIDDIRRRLDLGEHLLIILRGCPGSGKSTLAKALNDGYHGQIFSSDEYFKDAKSNEFIFESIQLDEAHRTTYRLVSDAFKQQISPIIIDNTNTTSWEMKTYVSVGQEAAYEILLVEPQTPWRYKARELVKRNLHNLPVRRIKEMLNRFEHNVTVQSILEQTKNDLCLSAPAALSQPMLSEQRTNQEAPDPGVPSRKYYDLIDDPSLLNDVRLCINDMILLLSSNFYQTSQSSTSLSVSFSDLSLIPSSSTTSTSSLPNTPSTSHSLFHRSLSRFSSTTSNQEHSFSNEHLLRLPAASFSRCADHLTSPAASANTSLLGKKRRKNKPKQELSNESLLNTNNSNNRCYSMQDAVNRQAYSSFIYQVLLPDDYSDFLVIDDSSTNDQCDLKRSSHWNHSSTIPHQKPAPTGDKCELLNIIRDELTTPSAVSDESPSTTRNHIAVQCSADHFNQAVASTDRVLVGRLLTHSNVSAPVSPAAGYTDCSVQVDMNSDSVQSFAELTQLYSDRLPVDLIKQFYEVCQADIQWTRAQLDDHLQHKRVDSTIPTLRQLSLNTLNRWDTQIKHSNPSFDTISIGDLLQDINDEGPFEELIGDDDEVASPQAVQFSETKEVLIPWPLANAVQELYGDIANLSSFASDTNGISMPLDDELTMNIYHALQRFVGISNVHQGRSKPVNEKKGISRENKKVNNQQWKLPSQTEPKKGASNKSSGPSLKEIMDEELNYINTQKPNQKPQLDFASQHKLKELERQFPTFGSDVLYEIFRENEFDYDLTLVCVSSMLDENAPIVTAPKPTLPPLSMPPIRSPPTNNRSTTEADSALYGDFRRTAQNHALKRKDCYQKADQANRQGMTGVASYYINQAREQTQLIKDANRLACEQLSQKRLTQFRQTHRLDLHELYADEALSLFQRVEQELYEGNRRTTALSIEVITGYGKGSIYGGGCGKIRSVILAYLRQKKYKYSEQNKGAILVQLTNAR